MLRGGALREACAVATGGSWREILMDEAVAGGCGWVCGWWLCSVVAGPAVGAWLAVVGAWLAVVGGCVGGIATIGAALRRVVGVSGVYGRKTPRGCSEGPASRARGGVYGSKSPVWLLKVQSTSVESG